LLRSFIANGPIQLGGIVKADATSPLFDVSVYPNSRRRVFAKPTMIVSVSAKCLLMRARTVGAHRGLGQAWRDMLAGREID
jgi:hypothetical protein